MGLFTNDEQESVQEGGTYSVLQSGIEKLLRKTRGNIGYYEISPYLNKAIKKRASKVSEIKFYLTNEQDEEVWDDEWLDLLNKPNEFHSGPQFWKIYQIHKDIYGEAYIWMEKSNGKIKNLHILNPSKVNPNYDQRTKVKRIIGYSYRGREFNKDEILHDFNPNPKEPTKAEPLITEGGRKILKTEEQINTYHSMIMENGGTANKIISIKGDKNRKRSQEQKDKLENKIVESSQTGKPIYFAGDVEIKDFGVTPDELNFIDTKRALLEDVAVMTGVPASVLSSYIDTKYSNADEAKKNFLRETIKPEMEALVNFLNQKLIPEQLELKFIDPTPQNTEEKIEIFKVARKAMTLNEQRKYLSKLDNDLDLDEVDQGDEIKEEGQTLKITTN